MRLLYWKIKLILATLWENRILLPSPFHHGEQHNSMKLSTFLLSKISYQCAHTVTFKAQPDLSARSHLPLTGPPKGAFDRTSGKTHPLNSGHIWQFRLENLKINPIASLLTQYYIYFLLLHSHSLYLKYILYIHIQLYAYL